jgi:hypothetical protein
VAGPPIPAHTAFAIGDEIDMLWLLITFDRASAGVDVLVEVVDVSTGDTVETLLDDTKNFEAGVGRTLEDLGASNYTCDTAGEFVLRRTVSGGTPTVETESSDYGFAVEIPATAPGAPGWGGPPVPGDGQVTLAVLAADPTDWIYARHRRFLSTGAWSAESETFKRQGFGDIVITGLTNGQYSEFIIYAKAGAVCSEWSEPRCAAPTDGSSAVIDQIMDAVAAQINLMGLASKTEAGVPVAVAAEVEVPPAFEQVDTPIIKVFPDGESGEASHNELNEIRYHVNVAFCQRSKTEAQLAEQLRVREKLRDQFLGKRLVGMIDHYCEKETETGVLDLSALWERFQHVSVITFEFVALRAAG